MPREIVDPFIARTVDPEAPRLPAEVITALDTNWQRKRKSQSIAN